MGEEKTKRRTKNIYNIQEQERQKQDQQYNNKGEKEIYTSLGIEEILNKIKEQSTYTRSGQ